MIASELLPTSSKETAVRPTTWTSATVHVLAVCLMGAQFATAAVTREAWYPLGEQGAGSNNVPLDYSGNRRHFIGSNGSNSFIVAGGAVPWSISNCFFAGTNSGCWTEGYNPPEDNVGIECWAHTTASGQTNKTIFCTGINGLQLLYDKGFKAAIHNVAFVGGTYRPPSTREWVHLALVRTNGVALFYVNGVQCSAPSTAVPGDALSLHMGVAPGGAGQFMGGIDEARVFIFTDGAFSTNDLACYAGMHTAPGTFRSILRDWGADPWVTRWRGYYYYCLAEPYIRIARAARLQDIAFEPAITVWTPPPSGPYSKNLWAPELHCIQGTWYIYFAADDGSFTNHHMYVLESATDDPQGAYAFKGTITDASDSNAIDGTVMEHKGKLYFIDACNGALYIAPMSNAWSLGGNRTCIARATYPWELHQCPVNEGPEVLKHGDKTFIIYSASGSAGDDYCLGRLTLTGANVLAAGSWAKHPSPVFSKNSLVFGPGHASFTTSPDGTEDWMVYHALRYSGAGWDRTIRAQRFGWNPDGTPEFGTPIPSGVHLPNPSGTPCGVTYEAEDARINNARILPNPWASGQGQVGFIDCDDSYVEFSVAVVNAGHYRLYLRYAAGVGDASHRLSVNGTYLQEVRYPSSPWGCWRFQTNTVVSLRAGTNIIRLAKGTLAAELDLLGVRRYEADTSVTATRKQ